MPQFGLFRKYYKDDKITDEMGKPCSTKIRLELVEGRDDSEDIGINGRLIIELILRKVGGRFGMDCSGSYEHGDEPTGQLRRTVGFSSILFYDAGSLVTYSKLLCHPNSFSTRLTH